jgi:cytosine/adenosine deaminase-related metal-dependent hydrolase
MVHTLIRGATLLTLDSRLGDIDDGDLLIEGERIAAIGHNLPAPAGCEVVEGAGTLVIPGLVNAHIHTWQIGLRGIGADWVSSRDYQKWIHAGMAQHYQAEDNRVANLLGALAQVNGGVTTIFDWCHNLRTPEMADASIDALEESGIRAVFGHGTAKPPPLAGEKPHWQIPHPREEIRRLRTGRLASDERKVTLAMAILGPDDAPHEIVRENVRLAREFGLIASAHTWGRAGKRFTPEGMWRLAREGLLGPDHNLSHGNNLEDDELKMILDHGCTISATPLTEMLNNDRVALLGRVAAHGAMPSLGSDVDPYFNASMLAVTRHAFQHQREIDNRRLSQAGEWPSRTAHATTTRKALEWATIGGAHALGLEKKIGTLTVGKQADLAMIRCDGPTVFPSLDGGDPAHIVVTYAEQADVDSVWVAGKTLKRRGKLLFPAERMRELKERLLASRERLMHSVSYPVRRNGHASH